MVRGGEASDMCAALDALLKAAQCEKNTEQENKIRKTQKKFDCRRSRRL